LNDNVGLFNITQEQQQNNNLEKVLFSDVSWEAIIITISIILVIVCCFMA